MLYSRNYLWRKLKFTAKDSFHGIISASLSRKSPLSLAITIKMYYSVSALARARQSVWRIQFRSWCWEQYVCTYTYTENIWRVSQIRGRNSAVPNALLPPTTLRPGNPPPPNSRSLLPDDIPAHRTSNGSRTSVQNIHAQDYKYIR